MILAWFTSRLSVSRSIASVLSVWRLCIYSMISGVFVSDLNSISFLAAWGFVSLTLVLMSDLNSYFLKKSFNFGESSKFFNFSIWMGSSRSFFKMTNWWLILADSSWSWMRFLIRTLEIWSFLAKKQKHEHSKIA